MFGIRVPNAHGQYTGVVSKHDLDAALRSLVTLARFCNVIEVDDAALQMEVAWARVQGTKISLFVIVGGLQRSVSKA